MKNLKNLYIGRLISNFGDSLLMIAFPLYIYQQTESIILLSIVSFCTAIPYFIAFLFAPILENKDPKKILVCTEILQLLLIASMFVLLLLNSSIYVCIFLIMIVSLTNVLISSVEHYYISVMDFTSDKLLKANANLGLTYEVVRLFGSAFAAIIFIQFGMKVLLVIDIMTFFVSIYMFSKLNKPHLQTTGGSRRTLINHFKEIKDGFVHFKEAGSMFLLSGIEGIMNGMTALGGVFYPMYFSIYFSDLKIYSIFLLAMSIGSLIGIYCGKHFAIKFKVGMAMIVTNVLSGICYGIAFLTYDPVVIVIGIFFCYFFIGFNGVYYDFLFMKFVKPEFINRVGSLITFMLSAMTPIFVLFAPITLRVIGIPHIFYVIAVVNVLLTLVWLKNKEFRRLSYAKNL